MYKVLEERYLEQGVWHALSIVEEIRAAAEKFGERTAIVSGTERVSYTRLVELAEGYAAGFLKLGIRPGDRVVVQLPNRLSLIVTMLGLMRFGAVPIMALPASRQADIVALCRLGEPAAYITTDRYGSNDYAPIVRELSAGHGYLRHFITDNGAVPGTVDLRSLYVEGGKAEAPFPSFRDTGLLLLSGGTTGTPKLIPRRHADYMYNARAAAERAGLDAGSSYLVVLPAAHNFSLSAPGIFGTLLNGGKVVLAASAGVDEAFELIEKEKVTYTALVPALLNLWLEAREWEEADLSSLRFIQAGGAAVDPGMAARVLPELGCKLMNVFGTAEGLISMTAPDDSEDIICTTQGTPISALDEVRMVGFDGIDVPRGEVGEMIVRGPYTIQGYYRAEEANKTAVTEDGFYRTGDLARFTDEGRIVVCGRIKEQINRAGEKIAPVEVEVVLREMPGVQDAAVVGVADEGLGERTCAWISTEDGAEVTMADVYAFFAEKGMARHKYPDQLELVDAWPLTSVGKIDKIRLAGMAKERTERSAASSQTV